MVELPEYLLVTRLVIPSRPRNLLLRERLLAALHSNTDRRLILVSAPAGFGKTSLLTDFAHDTTLPVCWYSVDESHSDERLFLEYLAAAIQRRFPRLSKGRAFQWLGKGEHPWDRVGFLTALINDIQELVDEYFVLVIDDYHLVENKEHITRSLDWFLERVGDNCCLILSSRSIPPLSFLRLAAHGQVIGLGTEELRFNEQEIQALFIQNHRVRLPDDQVRQLAKISEGWITGLLLSTQSMWRGAAESLVAAKKSGLLFEYLAAEVLEAQEAEVQDFLLRSSVLPDLAPAICNEMLETGGAAEILSLIEQRNLFISVVDEKERVYRYHSLFREFLLHELETRRGKGLKGLRLRAARALGSRGRWEEALPLMIAAGEFKEAASLLQEIAPRAMTEGSLTRLSQSIDSLPKQILSSHPYLLWSRSMVAVERGELKDAQRLSRQALQRFTRRRDGRGRILALLQMARVHRLRGEFNRALALAQRALDLLQEGIGDDALEARVLRALGLLYGVTGDLEKSIPLLRRAFDRCVAISDEPNAAYIATSLGTSLRHQGNLVEADHYYHWALETWRRLGNVAEEGRLLDNIAVGHYYEGDYRRALEVFDEALAKARSVPVPTAECNILAGIADVYRELGRFSEAREKYRECIRLARGIEDKSVLLYANDGLAETLRREGDLPGASARLQRSLEMVKAGASGLDQIRVFATAGLLAADSGRTAEARSWLLKAKRAAEKARAGRELARVLFSLGMWELAFGSREKALEFARKSLELIREGKTESILLNQASKPLLQLVADSGVMPDYIAQLLSRIDSLQSLALPHQARPQPIWLKERLEVRALGGGRVWIGGQELPHGVWVARQARELFFLLLDRGPKTREEIGVVFWPELSPERVTSVFHATKYRIRRVLRGERIVFDAVRNVYEFNRELDYWYDVETFEGALASARRRREQPEAALSEYRTAISLYGDDFLPEVDAEWADRRRDSLAQAFVEALGEAAQLLLDLNDPAAAAEYLAKAYDRAPYREDILRKAIVALTMANRRGEALELYEAALLRLQEEMGTGASAETISLVREVRGGTPARDRLLTYLKG